MGHDEARSASVASGDPLQARRGYQLAVLVLVGSLLMVVLYARSAGERERRLAQADFVAQAEQTADLIRQRLLTYELTARGGVSLFASVDWPSARQWRDYADGLRIDERSLGLIGLGYAAWLTPAELTALQLEVRATGRGLYRVRPHGARERYGPVVYLAPSTPDNRDAIGYDMYSEPTRRAAMEAARDSGEIRLSAPVHLQHRGARSESDGLLLYAPVYAAGRRPGDVATRRASLQGWVYVPFDAPALVESALAPVRRGLSVRIVDTAAGVPLYADPGFERIAASASAFGHSIEREMYGRTWQIDFGVEQGARTGTGQSALQATLMAGLLVSLLLFAVVWALARTQSHAQRLAARMSESYRRSEQRFRSAMTYSAIGKALLDQDGRIVEANPALARIFGVALADLPGKVFGNGLVEADEAAQDRDDSRGVVRATRTLRRPAGGLRQVQLTYAPVPGDIGSGVVRLVQVEDVTERLRAEARVRELNRTLEARVALRTRELRHANQELESFAYSVSHDLRAPLRSIDGFGRMLAERYRDAVDETGRDYIGRIRAATRRMDELIDALLKMSRLSRTELRRVPLDLTRIAEEVVAELRLADPDRDVDTIVASDLHACGDAALVRDLLQNLIGNAWKFTRGTPDARIEFGRDADGGKGPVFFVRDNGAGFAQEYAAKLFRPFQRLHSQEEFPGHGIGLASVRRIVDRHGGEVRAEGAPGQGACFRFSLPDEPAEA